MTAFHLDRKKDQEILRRDNKTTHDRLAAQSDRLAAQSDQLAAQSDQLAAQGDQLALHRQEVAHLTNQVERLVVAFTPDSKHKARASSKLLGAVVVDDSSSAASSRLSSVVSATEDNRNLAKLKKMEAENKKLHQDMKSVEMKNKQLEETLRVKNETPSMKKLRAKPRKQPLSENMENSINIHVGNNISGRASRSSARTPLGDANQDTSNPGLRRSARNLGR
jgi:ABC-type transporter Mla subunit MlaD